MNNTAIFITLTIVCVFGCASYKYPKSTLGNSKESSRIDTVKVDESTKVMYTYRNDILISITFEQTKFHPVDQENYVTSQELSFYSTGQLKSFNAMGEYRWMETSEGIGTQYVTQELLLDTSMNVDRFMLTKNYETIGEYQGR